MIQASVFCQLKRLDKLSEDKSGGRLANHPSENPSEKALNSWLMDYIIQNFEPIEGRADMSLEDFNKYYRCTKPVLLKAFTTEWATQKKWDWDFFKKSYGHMRVPVNNYTANSSTLTFQQLIDGALQGSSAAYLQEWNFIEALPELKNDLKAPKFVSGDDDKVRRFGLNTNYALWMGGAGVSTFIHRDAFACSVWNSQIRGKKRWLMFPPDTPDLAKDFRDMGKDPKVFLSENKPYHCDVEEGDLIYVPTGWWHRVFTLEPSINLSIFFVEPDDIHLYVKELRIYALLGWLNQEKIKMRDPGRFKAWAQRARSIATNLGVNPDDVMGLDTDTPSYAMIDIVRKIAAKKEL